MLAFILVYLFEEFFGIPPRFMDSYISYLSRKSVVNYNLFLSKSIHFKTLRYFISVSVFIGRFNIAAVSSVYIALTI